MTLNFNKNVDGLLPAIIQDIKTQNVLMLGYMNEEALAQTQKSGQVTFYSRSKKRLWTKGEESGNFLEVVSISEDCDKDTLLIQVNPKGPTCHKGTDTCWGDKNVASYGYLTELEQIIDQRKNGHLDEEKESYVGSLFEKGINKIAQKVGEEAVETVIEALDSDDTLFCNESADLLFHFLILLQAKGYRLNDIVQVLEGRKK